MPFEFLIANDDGSVNLKTWPGLDERLWTPAKNEDGSWSVIISDYLLETANRRTYKIRKKKTITD